MTEVHKAFCSAVAREALRAFWAEGMAYKAVSLTLERELAPLLGVAAAAEDLAEAGRHVGFGYLPSAKIHAVYDAVRAWDAALEPKP